MRICSTGRNFGAALAMLALWTAVQTASSLAGGGSPADKAFVGTWSGQVDGRDQWVEVVGVTTTKDVELRYGEPRACTLKASYKKAGENTRTYLVQVSKSNGGFCDRVSGTLVLKREGQKMVYDLSYTDKGKNTETGHLTPE